MPVINFSLTDLQSLVGKKLDYETLVERLPMMGADIHLADRNSDEMAFEFFPDRPDLYSVEGIARALRAFLDFSPGLKQYALSESDIVMNVDSAVDEVRPIIWCAMITDVEMNDYLIRSLMDIQEKLHLTVGRNRSKVAIGVHDFDTVKPPFLYTASDPTEVSFFPLQGTREMNLKQILSEHEKGKDYAFTLEGKEKYPIIFDSENIVISFPPVINGITTAITEETKNIFIECTGTDLNAQKAAVNIIATALAERKAKVHTVKIVKDGEEMVAPDLQPWEMKVVIDEVKELIGIDQSPDILCNCLARMGYDATSDDSVLKVKIPAYRYDILHPADIIEDIAKAYGYEKFGLKLPAYSTLGVSDSELDFWNVLRDIMVGLQYIEVTTLTLSGRGDQYERMNREEPVRIAEVKNPRSVDHSILRTSLLPELMAILRKNKHRDLPQRIFEVGEVVVDLENSGRIAGASIHSKASFTEMKSTVEAILRFLGIGLKISASEDGAYLKGRCAGILIDNNVIGNFGEIRPEVITAFELGYPVAAFEMSIDPLRKKTKVSFGESD